MKILESTTKFQYNKSFYQGRRVLVFGGLGFIGQNLVRELASLGSVVKIVDLDGSWTRISDFPRKSVPAIYYVDKCEKKLIDREISRSEIIFNLAGRSGVVDSFQYPEESLKNCSQHLDILQMCRKCNPKAVVVFPSSCLVYGDISNAWLLPIHEDNRTIPVSPYAIHKYTCEMYSRLYREVYGLSAVVVRIPNPIGPYQYRIDGSYGVYNQFIYLATQDQDIMVYGEGHQLRDILGVDDLVQAFLYCAAGVDIINTVNVGRGVGISLRDYAHLVVDTVGSGRVVHVGTPKGIVPTDFVADISRIRELTDWQPNIDLNKIIVATAEFYRQVNHDRLIGV